MDYPTQNNTQSYDISLSTLNERVSFGHKLYVAAWSIEILAAIVGLSVAIAMTFSSLEHLKNSGMTEFEVMSEVVLGSIPFVMVAIVELLKIPMVYLIYTSPSFKQKAAFSAILIGLTFITFETVAGGFERQYSAITKKVSAPIEEVRANNEQIAILEKQNRQLESTSETTVSNKYKELRSTARDELKIAEKDIDQQIIEIQSGPEGEQLKLKKEKLDKITGQKDKEVELLMSNAKQSSKDSNEYLKTIRDSIKEKQLRVDKNNQIIEKNPIFCFGPCATAKDENKSLLLEIRKLDEELRNSRFDVTTEINSINAKYQNQIDELQREIDELNHVVLRKNTSNFQVDSLNKEKEAARSLFQEKVKEYNQLEAEEKESLKEINVRSKTNKEKIRQYIERNETIKATLDNLASATQLYRFAKYWKQAFTPEKHCVEYKDGLEKAENTEKDQPGLNVFEKLFSSNIESECIRYENSKRVLIQDITEDDVTKVAFVWYGSLALLVSIMGVVVAYGAFVLKYPRKKHYMREEYRWSLSKTMRNWFAAMIKKARKPRPTKEIPVEVVKEVPVDKVAFKEVPIEVVKKEVVHTPIYTNDPELLKFGTTKIKDVLKDKEKDTGE